MTQFKHAAVLKMYAEDATKTQTMLQVTTTRQLKP